MAGFREELERWRRDCERMWADAERVLEISGGRREVEYELQVARWNPLLDAREHRALELRFGVDGAHPKLLDEVATACGCSVEEASMLIAGALKKIKPTAMPDHSDERRCRACKRDLDWHCHHGINEPARGELNRTLRTLWRQGVCSRKCQHALGTRAVR